MKLTITTTSQDEVDELVDLHIPSGLQENARALAGLRELASGTQEISLKAALQIAELVYLDLGEMSGVRCWLQP